MMQKTKTKKFLILCARTFNIFLLTVLNADYPQRMHEAYVNQNVLKLKKAKKSIQHWDAEKMQDAL